MRISGLPVKLVALGYCFIFAWATGQAQTSIERPPGAAVLRSFAPLEYPKLALQVFSSGDLDILVSIQKNGSIKSAELVRGHPLLAQTALDNAWRSRYECLGCGADGAELHVLYSFKLDLVDCESQAARQTPSPQLSAPRPLITEAQSHITILQQRDAGCEGPSILRGGRIRSIKCLYLWRCALE